jgi:hypothetical protein
VIGESDWIGISFYIAFIAALLKILLVEIKKKMDGYRNLIFNSQHVTHQKKNSLSFLLIAVFSFLFLLSKSLTTANFTSLFDLFLCSFFFGTINQNNDNITTDSPLG